MRALVSARLGADFTRLWTASAVSNVGDGVTLAAGPLLVASLTSDPALVAGAALAQQLPWLLVAPLSGVYVDRLDRRRLVVVVNVLRGAALAVLAAAVAASAVSVPLVYAVFFLLGVGETLADTAFGALLPATVEPERLPAANSRLTATAILGNQIAAKPLGGWLFALGAALPFAFDAVTFLVAAALTSAVRVAPAGRPAEAGGRSLRREVAAGVRWLWRHRLLRTLAASMAVSNVAFCAPFAVFALYAQQRLHLTEVGYGVLLTAYGVGGLVGTALASRLQARLGARTLLRAGLVLETATHAVLAATTHPLVAGGILIAFGVHSVIWGVIVATLFQRSVPDELRGRVGSVYQLTQIGGAALGSLLGGLIAQAVAITTPFWAAALAMTVITAVAWRPLAAA
ncbi:MFS family permease [Thermocatellispora tengchongensis]|uniref:MFS family permease n=1 Tax=Thermocatellispora tengchongensis TaxID=1073253 RepID=A0A840PMV8_9ACTN|nr:MFS transporter [Thermocatellispora tengchongensis]MBB5140226.1 MFS family permease [Thermocatellispora tengchongensis]